MRAIEPMLPALLGELDARARGLEKRLRRADKGDPDGVHDSRTVVRRLRVELDVLSRVAPDAANVRRLDDRLRTLGRALGTIRDEDVLLAHIGRSAKDAPGAPERRDFAPLIRRVEDRRAKRARRTRRALAKGRALVRELRRCRSLGGDRLDDSNAAKARPVLVRHFAAEEVAHAYDAVLAYESRTPENHEILHAFRAACRRLRYLIELFENSLSNAAPVIEDLRSVQDLFGELHDHHLAVCRIQKWLARGRLPHNRTIVGYLRERRNADHHLFREAVTKWQALLGGGFRERLARMFLFTDSAPIGLAAPAA